MIALQRWATLAIGGVVAAVGLFEVATAAVGRTPGAFEVSESGEANYSISIFAPPGANGMTPNLALSYGHRNGGTLSGEGWGVAGLSTIGRCAKSWAQDGVSQGVKLNTTDRFCLNGQQLKLESGTYGAHGAVYRTEIETFSRVTSYTSGGAGYTPSSGPMWFKVEMKDGRIYEYGATDDSRVQVPGTTIPRIWAANKVYDRAGNYITFSYTKNTTNGSYRINTVNWAGNTGQGLTAPYQTAFTYETQPAGEIESRYLANGSIKDVTRLTQVNVTHSGTLVRRYNLAYEASLSSTSKSRLASVTECGGSSGTDCLSPTTFSYQNGTTAYNSAVATGISAGYGNPSFAMDVNGDGRTDLVYASSAYGTGTWRVALSNGSGYSAPINTGISDVNASYATPIDYNADGLEDLVLPYNGTTWWVLLGTTSGLASPANTGIASVMYIAPRAMDINGDGLDDLVWTDGAAVNYRLREWGATFSSTVYTLFSSASATIVWMAYESANGGRGRNPDFNGDGRDDVILIVGECDAYWNCSWYTQIVLSGTGQSIYYAGTILEQFVTGDFNGDGYSDIAETFSNVWYYRFGTGSSLTAFTTGPSLSNQYGALAIATDWDGDGFEDIVVPGTDGVLRIMRSTGEALSSPVSTGVNVGAVWMAFPVDINGDGLLDASYMRTTGEWVFTAHSGVAPDLLQTATDGYGNAVTFAYVTLAQGNYTKYSDAAYPYQDYQGALSVVDYYVASNGIGGTYSVPFHYWGMWRHIQGRGLSSFYAMRSIDSRTGIFDYRYTVRGFPYSGMALHHHPYQPDWSPISQDNYTLSLHTYGSGFESRYLPYTSGSTHYRYEVGGPNNTALLTYQVASYAVDSATGLQTSKSATTTEQASGNGLNPGASWTETSSVTSTYSDWTNWCIGRPATVLQTQSHSLTNGGSQTRTSSATWNGAYCRPTQNVLQPGDPSWAVTTAIGYDGFGNVNSQSVTGVGMAARTTTATWGSTGQFPLTVTNPLSHVTTKTWNYGLGVQASETDPNGLVVSWGYDNFGRKISESRPDGTATTWNLNACTAPTYCGASWLRYYVYTYHLAVGGAAIRLELDYYDQFDRRTHEYEQGLSGNWSYMYRNFNARGGVDLEYFPYQSGATSWPSTSFTYDLLGRLTQSSRPTSATNSTPVVTTTSYRGLRTIGTDGLGKNKTVINTAMGQVARSVDHDGYYQQFSYDAFGNAVSVVDSNGATLQTASYNIRGLRYASSDADMGAWGYTFNALGEMTAHTDALGQTTSYGFDALGRMTSRVEPHSGGSITSSWIWGSSAASKNIGRLQHTAISGTGITTYNESNTFDSIGRLVRTVYFDGTAYHQYDSTYNSTTGLLDSVEYPTSTSGYRHKVVNEYSYGQLWKVRDFGNSVTYWQANAADARGMVTSEALGNGLVTSRSIDTVTGLPNFIRTGPGGGTSVQNLNYGWNVVGSLTSRNDANQSLTETFAYDNIHRLDYSQLNGSTNLDASYAANGNISWRSDVGSYTYHGTKIHAVTGAGGLSYGYDANGNVTSKNGAAVTWYASNLPKSIANGTYSSTFEYGPNRNYWKQTATYSNGTETTRYIGGLLEIVSGPSVTAWRHQIQAGATTVAVYTRGSNGTNTTIYPLKDHLGSTEAVTNSSGTMLVKESFAAFGGRRGSNWSGAPSGADMTAIGDATRRGFTDHSMLDNVGLVHMNGRVFDPAVGRFLSADSIVDGELNTQGWNRYAYLKNNPLSATDPTGHCWRDHPENWGNPCDDFIYDSETGELLGVGAPSHFWGGSGRSTTDPADANTDQEWLDHMANVEAQQQVARDQRVAEDRAFRDWLMGRDDSPLLACVPACAALPLASSAAEAWAASVFSIRVVGVLGLAPLAEWLTNEASLRYRGLEMRYEMFLLSQQGIAVHANSYASNRATYVYELVSTAWWNEGETYKYGITSLVPPQSRYPAWVYDVGRFEMEILGTYPNRSAARAQELALCTAYVASHDGRLPPMSLVC